jgi:MFS family permease
VLLEVPTGAVADLFGRKITYILGELSTIIGIVFLYFGSSLTPFIIFALLNALGQSLRSGNDEAIIYDTLKEENKAEHYKKVSGTLAAIWPFGAIIGSVAGGFMAKVSLSLPILLSFIPLIISLALTLFIVEPKYQKEKHKNVFSHMNNSINIVWKNKQVLLLMVAAALALAFGESAHNLKSIYFAFKNIPIEYFGIIFGAVFGLSSLGHYWSHSFSKRFGDKATLIFSGITFPVLLLLSALTQGVLSMTFIVLTSIPFGLKNPVIRHLINVETESAKRATILSMNNLFGSLGVALGALLLGHLADLYNINNTYIIAAICILVASVLFFFVKERRN